MSVLILPDDISRNTAAARYLQSSSASPFPDRFGVETAIAVTTPTSPPARPPYFPGGINPRLEDLAELVSILTGEIDLVARSIKRKGDRLSGFPTIDVVGQYSYNLLGHAAKSNESQDPGVVLTPSVAASFEKFQERSVVCRFFGLRNPSKDAQAIADGLCAQPPALSVGSALT